jgi:hypothetical protein
MGKKCFLVGQIKTTLKRTSVVGLVWLQREVTSLVILAVRRRTGAVELREGQAGGRMGALVSICAGTQQVKVSPDETSEFGGRIFVPPSALAYPSPRV